MADHQERVGAAEPVGSEGVVIFRGSSIQVRDLKLSIGSDGTAASSMRLMVSWELWPLWLRVAIDHEVLARSARANLLGADDAQRAGFLEDEARAGMVTVCAAAFVLEAVALSAASHAELSFGIGSRAGAARRLTEVLKQCFVVPPDRFMVWRKSVRELFAVRNAAVHADSGLKDPLPHPALRAYVPRPAHMFRLENAVGSVDVALNTMLMISGAPRPRLGRRFREATALWNEDAKELQTLRELLRSPA